MPAYRIYIDAAYFIDINAETHEELPAADGQPARLHFKDKDGKVIAAFGTEKIQGFTQREALAPATRR